tara:strand:- start:44 stop:451 length:408 start_codon:yes stop_codon:yes gene_type:complete
MTYIYKILDIDTDECYIGSTKQNIKLRMKDHRNKRNNTGSKKIIDGNNYDVIILEKCEEKNRFIREQYYINISKNTLNKTNAIHDKQHRRQWLDDNKDNKKNYDKIRREWIKSFGYKLDNYNYNNLLRIDTNLFN